MIYPVILCGGSGTRLWPLSRQSYPKQFAKLIGEHSLFQQSALRLLGDKYYNPIVVTGEAFRFICKEQLAAINVKSEAIIIEPEGRNTAPAIVASALYLHNQNKDGIMLIMPSDHVIPNSDAFRKTVESGIEAAEAGKIITFGISPTAPETGYGYLELKEAPSDKAIYDLKSFVEKPNLEAAVQMLATGKYLWNAGIFMFKVSTIIEAFKTYAPDILEAVSKAINEPSKDLGFTLMNKDEWAKASNISVDYAIMEKASNIVAIPYYGGWSDLGGWAAVWAETAPDENGVVCSDNATAIDCKDSLLRSEAPNLELVGIGLEDIITIAMPDAVVVAKKSEAQRVKDAVAALKDKGKMQATMFPKEHRPWGWYESLAISSRFQVKRIMVKPDASLSLQSHFHRAEHWIVVEGTAKVTIGEKEQLVTENQSVYIPIGHKHRLENPGKVPVILIEVQTGSYLGEDDIVRYQDIYARN